MEVTPDVCPLCRENQQHITGDIAWAARTYVSMTWDLDWLEVERGNELILEMAKFWQSRPEFNDATERYDINRKRCFQEKKYFQTELYPDVFPDVMPPDEHQEDINNSIYTNLVANLAVNTARWTSCLTDGEPASIVNVPDEWLQKMKQLTFLYNEEYQYHEEYEGFEEQYRTGVYHALVLCLLHLQ